MIATPLTGRKVLLMFTTGFATIIAVNLTLAFNAVKTFPGLEVANSYIASQNFEARRDAQDALGWDAQVDYANGTLHLQVTDADGGTVEPQLFSATIGRPTTRDADIILTFDDTGDSGVVLEPGRWRLDLASGVGQPDFARSLTFAVRP